MRLNPWQVILPLVLAAALLAVVLLHAAAPASCGDAHEAVQHSLLTAAEKEYKAVLEDEPGSDCANSGIHEIIAKLCRRADRLAAREVPVAVPIQSAVPTPPLAHDQAKEIYKGVLKIEPVGARARCALTGLADLPKPDPAKPSCKCGEVDNPDPNDPERQEAEKQQAEEQEAEKQEAEEQEAETQEAEEQEAEEQEPEVQERELQEPEHQEPEIQEWTG